MTHEEIKGIFADTYNKYYLKHRKLETDPPRTDEEWEAIVTDGEALIKKYGSSKFIVDLVLNIQAVFEEQEHEYYF